MRAFSIFSTPNGLSDADRRERRHMLARLGLAWLAMMQVMTLAFPGYLRSDSMGTDNLSLLDNAIIFMNWLSFSLTLPVVVYCAWPVWKGALARLRHASISMDVPVALGIVVAFIPSVVTTFTHTGQVYFESISMFVAFLLTARYLELCARQSVGKGGAHDTIEALRKELSVHANRVAFWFVLGQLLLAFLAGAVWWIIDPSQALAVMVALIVISCPCAMAMAVPSSIAAAHASLASQAQFSASDIQQLIQATTKISHQNLYGSVLWHLLVTPLAVMGWVAPWLAAITMLMSSLAVAANAMRLYRKHYGPNIWASKPASGQAA